MANIGSGGSSVAGGCASASIDEPNDGLVEREPSEDAESERVSCLTEPECIRRSCCSFQLWRLEVSCWHRSAYAAFKVLFIWRILVSGDILARTLWRRRPRLREARGTKLIAQEVPVLLWTLFSVHSNDEYHGFPIYAWYLQDSRFLTHKRLRENQQHHRADFPSSSLRAAGEAAVHVRGESDM